MLSGAATLLTHVNYPAGAHEVAIAATAVNGFTAGNTYGVFCTLLVDSQNPTGFVGSFKLSPVPANTTQWLGTAAHAATVNGIPVVQLHDSAGAGGINAPTNFEDLSIVDTSGLVAVPTTQKVDVETIKTQAVAVTAAGTVTFPNATVASTTNITGGVITTVTTTGTLTTYTGNTPQTGDAYTRLGAPVGASMSADVAAVKSDTAATLADTGTDGVVVAAASKTGYKLASDGLDSVATTAPTGVASNFREMVVGLWRRLFKKSTLTATQLKTYADDGTTVLTTQTVSDDDTTQTQGAAS